MVLLHERHVDAERHVVDEEPAVDRGVVDPPFDRVPKGVNARARVVAVETEILGEVVSRARRDADERDIALNGDRCHQGLRTVSTRHPQAVRPPGDGVPGELLQVESMVQHHGLHAELIGEFDEAELIDLAAARPRVADEHRMTGSRDRMRLEGILGMQQPDHGQTC